jgi:hypothetical protein
MPSSMLKNQMTISYLGGEMLAKHVCPKVSILIWRGGGVEFLATLIVLE